MQREERDGRIPEKSIEDSPAILVFRNTEHCNSAIDLIRVPAGFIIAIKEVFFPELFGVSVESTAHPAGVLSGSTTQQRTQHPSLGFCSESGRPVGIK